MQSAAEILGSGGPFAKNIKGYAPRQQQQEMAEAIAATIAAKRILIAEAGTGTGKTFAYLVPAILSGSKVIISTGTRNLQDQLYHKDLPMVRKALKVPLETALLKGRANYLCLHRMQLALADGRFADRQEALQLQAIRAWSGATLSGDIAECSAIPEASPSWSRAVSTADNCLGGDCEYSQECFLNKARRRAQEAELVVINHHLFFADLALRDSGMGELLPTAETFIFDEAHQMPEVAANFFGQSVTGNQLLELAGDVGNEDLQAPGGDRRLHLHAEKLEKVVRNLRQTFGESIRRGSWSEVAGLPDVVNGLAELTEQLHTLHKALESQAERGKGLAACCDRSEQFIERLKQLTTPTPPDNYVQWFETHKRSFSLNLTPLHVGKLFRQQMLAYGEAGWIFTSATIAVNGKFDHFTNQLGLQCAPAEGDAEGEMTLETCCWESPFDYPRQALLYVPEGMPQPHSENYVATIIEKVLPIIRTLRGGSFILFTSYRALHEAKALLLAANLPMPLLVQDEAPRNLLLEQFREHGNALLLGTGSFWEGVDVRGEALSCVVIDKLPFASPGDPLMQARIDAIRKAGGNPFNEYQIPQAVISLKQGVGRLIRDFQDFGLLILCDPRLTEKSYGRQFIEALPPMTRSRKVAVVERFFNYHYNK
ncbi:MAG: ATP-dependent DNA helicase [Gammaproteobacteria bacterium]|nr:ATP-dependent DNA helicase [Gammaproteobacteria bacterium]